MPGYGISYARCADLALWETQLLPKDTSAPISTLGETVAWGEKDTWPEGREIVGDLPSL